VAHSVVFALCLSICLASQHSPHSEYVPMVNKVCHYLYHDNKFAVPSYESLTSDLIASQL